MFFTLTADVSQTPPLPAASSSTGKIHTSNSMPGPGCAFILCNVVNTHMQAHFFCFTFFCNPIVSFALKYYVRTRENCQNPVSMVHEHCLWAAQTSLSTAALVNYLLRTPCIVVPCRALSNHCPTPPRVTLSLLDFFFPLRLGRRAGQRILDDNA